MDTTLSSLSPGRLRNLRAQISHRIARGLARPFDEQRLCAAADAAELAGA